MLDMLINNAASILPPFLAINLLIILVLFAFTLKDLKSQFKAVGRTAWLALVAIFLLGFIIRMFLIPHLHMMYLDEPGNIEVAKNLLKSGRAEICEYINYNETRCYNTFKSVGWPLIISIAFAIFGVNNHVAINLTALFGSLSVILIFLMAYLLFKKQSPALWSALLLALLPLHIQYSGSSVNNISALFFALAGMVFALVYLNVRDSRMGVLALSTFFYTAQIRPESILLLPLVLFMYFLFGGKIRGVVRAKTIIGSLFIVLIFLVPYAIQFQILWRANIRQYKEPYLNADNWQSNLSRIVYGITNYGNWIFVVFVILGILSLLKLRANVGLFLIMWLLLFLVVYLSTKEYQHRYLIILYPSTILMAAYGIFWLSNVLKSSKGRMLLTAFFVITLFYSYNPQLDDYFRQDIQPPTRKYLMTAIPELAEKQIPEDCYIISTQPILISSSTNLKVGRAYDVVNNPMLVKTLKDHSDCVLFFNGLYCRWGISTKYCKEMEKRYTLRPYLAYKLRNESFVFYRL